MIDLEPDQTFKMDEVDDMIKKLSIGKTSAASLQTVQDAAFVAKINEQLRTFKKYLGAPEDESVDKQWHKTGK